MRVSAGNALSYATLPGILPRISSLFFSGFKTVNQLMAIILFMVGLLPKTHECFHKDKRENYGLAKLIVAAGYNLDFKWKNIDKITVFALIICGIFIVSLYLFGIAAYLLTSPGFAASITEVFKSYPVTAAGNEDLAFMMLDKVFGIPDLYNSVVSKTAPFPNAFHLALHKLFSFYSWAIFVIAFAIFFFHMVHFFYEVTQTGKVTEHLSDDVMEPYASSPSKGFSWLPIRYAFCFGLLIPIGFGLNSGQLGSGFNSGQWIALYTAKFGSNLATNAWVKYNSITGDNPTGETNARLVMRPPVLDNSGLIKNLFMINSCRWINFLSNPVGGRTPEVVGYVVSGNNSKSLFNYTGIPGFMDTSGSGAYNATLPKIAAGDSSDHFIQILNFTNYRDIRIVIGHYDSAKPDQYKDYPGKILPVCGEIVIPVTGMTGEALFTAEGYLFAVLNIVFDVKRASYTGTPTPELAEIQWAYFREFRRNSSTLKNFFNTVPVTPDVWCWSSATAEPMLGPCDKPILSKYWNTIMDQAYTNALKIPPFTGYDFLANTDIVLTDVSIDPSMMYMHANAASYSAVGAQNPLKITAGITKYGWGGAGLWYNKISERNGSLYTASVAVPQIAKMPLVMEQVREMRMKTDKKVGNDYCDPYNPVKSGSNSTYLPNEDRQFEIEQAKALYEMCKQMFENENLKSDNVTRTTKATNPIERGIMTFFSQFSMFDREKNLEVNPMAQLSSIGRILVEKAIVGVSMGAASYAAGGVAHFSAGTDKQAQNNALTAGLAGDFMFTIALIGLSAGFVLYYMLPLLPFIYFFFAVGRWVKVIFEALCGIPLWALAHMKSDGPGLPGSAAIGGYFLILEIMIRPILTVFALVASFSIFSAMVVALNTIFSIISMNLFGSPSPAMSTTPMATEFSRGMIDQFFLSIFYVMIVYSIGVSCFKLIDILPDNIMRWSGAGVQSMGAADNADDLVDQWRWELPVRFDGATRDIQKLTKEALYNPGYNKYKADEALAKQKEEAAKQAAKAQTPK